MEKEPGEILGFTSRGTAGEAGGEIPSVLIIKDPDTQFISHFHLGEEGEDSSK